MNIESAFNDLGINAIVGTEMLDLLGLTTVDLNIPQRFSRLQAIIDYVKDLPADTRRFLVTKATRNKQVNRVDHVFEYINLLKEKAKNEKHLSETQAVIEKLSSVNDEVNIMFERQKEGELIKKISDLDDTISIYEK